MLAMRFYQVSWNDLMAKRSLNSVGERIEESKEWHATATTSVLLVRGQGELSSVSLMGMISVQSTTRDINSFYT